MIDQFRKTCIDLFKVNVEDMTQNTLKNKDLNLLSDCYVEYGRAVSMYNREECYIN